MNDSVKIENKKSQVFIKSRRLLFNRQTLFYFKCKIASTHFKTRTRITQLNKLLTLFSTKILMTILNLVSEESSHMQATHI